MNKPNSEDDQWRGFFIVSALGADVAACLAGGYFAGHYLGKWLGHAMAWTIGGTLAGLAAGIVSVILLLKSFSGGHK